MRLHISRFLSCLAILAVVGCDRMPGKPKEATPVVIGSSAWTQSTFNTNCRGCHSQGAEGAAIPLIDAGYWKVATDAQVIQVIAQGQGVLMPSYLDSNGGPMSSDQIAAFVKGMRTLWGAGSSGGQGGISGTVVAGNASAGSQVFASACASCHAAGGSAGSVTDPMYLKLISNQGLWSAIVYGRAALGSPAWNQPMPQHPNGLTPTEVADVVSWIAQSRPMSSANAQVNSIPKDKNVSDSK